MKAMTAMDEMSKGEFRRTASTFRNFIKADGSTPYTVETERYHLIISYACPWACRCLTMVKLKGLDDVVGVTVVDPIFVKTRPDDDEDKHHGWAFSESDDKFVGGAKTVREFYENNSENANKFTVPILYDKVRNEIVNNESSEILRMFGQEMNSLANRNKDWDPFPDTLKEQIESSNEWIYPMINDGVYRAGFAQSQEAYDVAVKDVFDGLEKVEEILSKQRYNSSPTQITEADIRLFVTLVRFDEVYHGHFKCNKKYIRDYNNITNYIRELYQITGIDETVNMYHIKHHYHGSHPTINKFGIVPLGANTVEDFNKPHNRGELFPLKQLCLV